MMESYILTSLKLLTIKRPPTPTLLSPQLRSSQLRAISGHSLKSDDIRFSRVDDLLPEPKKVFDTIRRKKE